ncbi:MAG: hypothetical protein FWC97_09255 [Treponema sp.]|nr:hypothetical protein [Treponema sp.]
MSKSKKQAQQNCKTKKNGNSHPKLSVQKEFSFWATKKAGMLCSQLLNTIIITLIFCPKSPTFLYTSFCLYFWHYYPKISQTFPSPRRASVKEKNKIIKVRFTCPCGATLTFLFFSFVCPLPWWRERRTTVGSYGDLASWGYYVGWFPLRLRREFF